jgi:hypothetical protein
MTRTWNRIRAQALAAVVASVTALWAVAGTEAAASRASCTGLAVASLGGEPGVVAQLTRELHQELKDAGLPPGTIDAIFSKLHEGSVEACLAAIG